MQNRLSYQRWGATAAQPAEGQRAVLEHYGVTEDTVGVPIKATMEVVEIGKTSRRVAGIPRYPRR